MEKIFVCIACLFYQITCVGMRHESVLSSVINSNGADITSRFGNLVGNSDPKDSEGVCYGTHGIKAAAAQAIQNGQPLPIVQPFLPRCHSEFFLLKRMAETHISLDGCSIVINNSQWPPCIKRYGEMKGNEKEFNPGIPCDEYLRSFAAINKCRIKVQYPPRKSKNY